MPQKNGEAPLLDLFFCTSAVPLEVITPFIRGWLSLAKKSIFHLLLFAAISNERRRTNYKLPMFQFAIQFNYCSKSGGIKELSPFILIRIFDHAATANFVWSTLLGWLWTAFFYNNFWPNHHLNLILFQFNLFSASNYHNPTIFELVY